MDKRLRAAAGNIWEGFKGKMRTREEVVEREVEGK